jgi:hypothetical protein
MSYEKVRSFNFSKDFKNLSLCYAANNVRPLAYYKQNFSFEDEKDKDITVFEWVKKWIKYIIEGSLQFDNKNHFVNFTINQTLKDNNIESNRCLWITEFDYNGEYDYENEKWLWQNENDHIAFNEAKENRIKIENLITHNVINNTYKKLYKELKSKKYYLKNNNNLYVKSLRQKSYRYIGKYNISKAMIFNGLQKEFWKNHFSITRDHYYFEEVL